MPALRRTDRTPTQRSGTRTRTRTRSKSVRRERRSWETRGGQECPPYDERIVLLLSEAALVLVLVLDPRAFDERDVRGRRVAGRNARPTTNGSYSYSAKRYSYSYSYSIQERSTRETCVGDAWRARMPALQECPHDGKLSGVWGLRRGLGRASSRTICKRPPCASTARSSSAA